MRGTPSLWVTHTHTTHTHYTQCGGDERHPFTLGNTYTRTTHYTHTLHTHTVHTLHTVWGR